MRKRRWPPRPGASLGPYPQRERADRGRLEDGLRRLAAPAVGRLRVRRRAHRAWVEAIEEENDALRECSDRELLARAASIREQIRRTGIDDPATVACFALAREAAGRTLGMRHHPSQLRGGLAIFGGGIAEMETGEGKTLTATLPAIAAGLAGVPVHLITANEYLAERDADLMGPVYRLLGLRVAVVNEALQSTDARRAAYTRDIVYSTNQQVAFDYLRDRCLLGNRRSRLAMELDRACAPAAGNTPVMRGLCYAIVDEADSVLIDDAATPLILTQRGRDALPDAAYAQALELAAELSRGVDFQTEPGARSLRLTETGRQRIEALSEGWGEPWHHPVRGRELVRAALLALWVFRRDEHYVVAEGSIHLIDQNTGRRMPDRSWEAGLHQLVETKEGCTASTPRETVARLSYQSFFRRYLWLGGMTGTADEAAPELWATYGLSVVPIAPHRPSRRELWPDRVYPDAQTKWAAVVDRAREIRGAGRAVLIGTRSVESSEALSRELSEANLAHDVLNARQDRAEAQIVARAGAPGAITVATNIAGRGTDIGLTESVAERGGLHVIAAEPNEARRIDRQLFGRCARQGDPGSCERIVSLDDEVLRDLSPLSITNLSPNGAGAALGARRVRAAQQRSERRGARRRREVSQVDVELAELLSFSGAME